MVGLSARQARGLTGKLQGEASADIAVVSLAYPCMRAFCCRKSPAFPHFFLPSACRKR